MFLIVETRTSVKHVCLFLDIKGKAIAPQWESSEQQIKYRSFVGEYVRDSSVVRIFLAQHLCPTIALKTAPVRPRPNTVSLLFLYNDEMMFSLTWN